MGLQLVRLSCYALLLVPLAACGDDPAPPTEEPGEPVIVTESVAYTHEGVELEGYLAYDDGRTGKRPGVLVIHEWWGLAEHPKERARRLAELGYVAFCLDMYGKGKLTDDGKQAGEWAGAFYGDRTGHGRSRLLAGLDVLRTHERVDASKIGAMGFCYGGSVALELAWSGADVKGVVSFHGSLTTPSDEDAKAVKAAVLVCHGAADPLVTPDQVKGFTDFMEKTAITWNLESYEGAVHAFTNKGADARGMAAIKYDKAADEKSWEHMRAFFAKHLGS